MGSLEKPLMAQMSGRGSLQGGVQKPFTLGFIVYSNAACFCSGCLPSSFFFMPTLPLSQSRVRFKERDRIRREKKWASLYCRDH